MESEPRPCLAQRRCTCPSEVLPAEYADDCIACRTWRARALAAFFASQRRY